MSVKVDGLALASYKISVFCLTSAEYDEWPCCHLSDRYDSKIKAQGVSTGSAPKNNCPRIVSDDLGRLHETPCGEKK